MTPAPPQPAPHRARIRAILTAVVGVVLLATLFLPARDPVTHSLAAEWRPSAELAGVLSLITMAALASPRLVTGRGFAFVLALLVAGAALLNLADAAAPSLLGRDLNLYWDLRHLPSLFGLARDSAGLWSASVAASAPTSSGMPRPSNAGGGRRSRPACRYRRCSLLQALPAAPLWASSDA